MLDKNGALPARGCASLDPHVIQSSCGMHGISHECPFLYTPAPMDGSRLLGYLCKYQQFWNLVKFAKKNCQHRVLTNAGRWPRHKSTQDSSISLTKCSFHIFPRLLYTTCLDNLRKDIFWKLSQSHSIVCEPVDVAINTPPQRPAAGHALRSWPKTSTTMDPAPSRLKHRKIQVLFRVTGLGPKLFPTNWLKELSHDIFACLQIRTTQIPPKDIGLFSTTKNGDSISI